MNPLRPWAVVPVKPFEHAKQRLASFLSAPERAALARAMFTDVLDALAASPWLAGILVVTKDSIASAQASRAGATVLPDSDGGLSAALERAARYLNANGVHDMLIVPADVPLITPADIETIVCAHRRGPSVTLVAASDDGGTNTLVCSPPTVIPLSFGTDSFRRHRQAAWSAGVEPKVLTLPRIGLDIDRPADLCALLAQPGLTFTHACLHAFGVPERLPQWAERPPTADIADSLTTLPRG